MPEGLNHVERLKLEKDGLDVWADIVRYAQTGFGSIDPDDFDRFKWYGLYQQRPKTGHFMLRVRIPGGQVTAAQLRRIGELTREYARGVADITTRQDIQLHWITIEAVPEIVARLQEGGLSTTGACGDITRNVVACPVAGVHPGELADTGAHVHEITRYFLGNREFSNLPRKWKIAVSACPEQCVQPEIHDVALTALRHPGSGEVGYALRVGGGLSAQPYLAQRVNAFVRPEQVLDVVRACTVLFRDHGYRKTRTHARLKFLVADWGVERFQSELEQQLGWALEPGVPEELPLNPSLDHAGVHAQRQPGLFWIGLSVLVGRLSAEQLLAAAEAAEEFGDGSLRTTVLQNLLLLNVPERRVERALAALNAAGLRQEASGWQRGAVACTGIEFCNLALTETKATLSRMVAELEQLLPQAGLLRINVNGCPNSCAQHHVADVGLQGAILKGADGREDEVYDLSLGGGVGRTASFGRLVQRRVPTGELPRAIAALVRTYEAGRQGDEAFRDWCNRQTVENLQAHLAGFGTPARVKREA